MAAALSYDYWVLVITLEENKNGEKEEVETVAPERWLSKDEKWLWWPPSLQVKNKIHKNPDVETWVKFPVLRIKVRGM